MNKQQKEVIKSLFNTEEEVIEELRKQYQKALNDINRKIRILQSDELSQSKAYQLEFQKALKGQVESILEALHGAEFSTIQAYLTKSYKDAFLGTMYDLHSQGIPLILPIDQKAVVRAVLTNSKIKGSLYSALGIDVSGLKKTISAEITRGLAPGMSYADIARNLNNTAKTGYSNAIRIVRTEGHRIQQASAYDAQVAAKEKGADVVKQWDSTLDGVTRPTHRELDGQIREVDEPFSIGSKKAMYPGEFGDPAEDCNCRCVSLTRAKWALDDDELKTLKQRAEFFGLDKTKDFDEFKEKYLKAQETLEKAGKSGTMKSEKTGFQFFASKEKQFGKKVGKHAADFGLDPSSEEDRQKFNGIIQDILSNKTEQRTGEWRGQKDAVIFHIKGDDVVITDQSGEFITILKGGINNERIKNARKREVP